MISKEFVLYTDHQSLKFLHSQKNVDWKHARWQAFLQKFTFSIKHKSEKLSTVADASSRRYALLITLQTEIIGFDVLKELYEHDEDFLTTWNKCLSRKEQGEFHIFNGYLNVMHYAYLRHHYAS